MKLLAGIVVGILGVLGYQHLQKSRAAEPAEFEDPASLASPERMAEAATAGDFKCDGRQHCSQMHSCEEAGFFLQHCPDVKMDGDNDGVPCERGVGSGPSTGC